SVQQVHQFLGFRPTHGLRRTQDQVEVTLRVQRLNTAGQLEPGTATDTTDPTAVVEHRSQLIEGAYCRQIPFDQDVTQRFRLDASLNPFDPHDRCKALFTQTPTYSDRDFARRAQRPSNHHWLPCV